MAVNHDYANVIINLKNRSNVETDFKNRPKAKINFKNRTKAEANFKNRPKADPDFKTRPNAETVFKNRPNAELKRRSSRTDQMRRLSSRTDQMRRGNSRTDQMRRRTSTLKTIQRMNWKMSMRILIWKVHQSFVIVLVILSILSKEISRTSLESHSTENIDIKECGTPPSIDHGLYIMTGNSTGTIALYACVEGYYMKGIPAVFCQADGAWSLVKFSCIIGFQEFEFDKSTLYNKRYISDDNKTVSNYKTAENMTKGNGYGSTYIYDGVLGTRPFTKHDTIYFEVVIYYKILRTLRSEEIAFELGFSRLHSIGL
ncbi:hypothetical protein KUTeg_014400 [Tegillarca granosa]|uniref:Sushi domain-containing protein n=1 Tax=Tegillarca granosa TaxID=220873 RepID=A0ABQ9EYZ3_TEGGR|nr:hypothetical protein KUTeg_014400 [Tegillarca granosa]